MDLRSFVRVALSCLLIALSLNGHPAFATQWSIRDPGQGAFNLADNGTGAEQLSGIVWASGDQYYAISDKSHKIYPLTIVLNADGTIQSATLSPGITLANADDLEGIAYIPANGYFLISDEVGPAIREHAGDGTLVQNVTVPSVFSHARANLGFEALTRNPDTGEVWTANEEALTVDGPVASFSTGSVVRLQRFDAGFTPNGQWAYVTDAIPGELGEPGRDLESSGISELIVAPGGELLSLERASGGQVFLRAELYQIDLNGASDTSALAALDGASYTTVTKRRLWSANGLQNFEGAGLGPTLTGGGRSLILISDNGSGLPQALRALILRPQVCGNGTVESPETCDDGNTRDNDGCSAACRNESCGDGVLNNGTRESCDDGNTADGDGCSAGCQLETEVRRCQETLIKAARGYALDRMKALRNCRDQLNRGRQLFLDEAKTQPLSGPEDCLNEVGTRERIGSSAARLRESIGNPMRARCQNNHIALLGACASTIDGLISPTADSGCLLTASDAAADRMVDDEYGRRLQPTESALRRCQDSISKAAAKYAEIRWQAINACQLQLIKGRTLFADELRQQPLLDPALCATEMKTARKIQRSAAKIRQSIAAPGREACTDAMISDLASTCATTVDGLVSPAGDGGCLISGHNAEVDSAITAAR